MDNKNYDAVQDAVNILRLAPFNWTASYEYPGFGLITFTEAPARCYAFGIDNDTVTVNQTSPDMGTVYASGDTRLLSHVADGWRMAIHVAAVIDNMEHEGFGLEHEASDSEAVQRPTFWHVGDRAIYVAGPPDWRDYVGQQVEVVHVGVDREHVLCATIKRLDDGRMTAVTADGRNSNIRPIGRNCNIVEGR